MKILSQKINIFGIVAAHLQSLKDQNTKKFKVPELITFAIVPVGLSILLIQSVGPVITGKAVGPILTAVSILLGFLFNMNTLLINLLKNENRFENDSVKEIRLKAIDEAYSNIGFSILIAFTAIIVIPFLLITNSKAVALISNSILYFLLIQFILHMFMILNRLNILFKKEMEMLKRPPSGK